MTEKWSGVTVRRRDLDWALVAKSCLWTLRCERCGVTFEHQEAWQVDGEATHHVCPVPAQ